MKLKIIIPLVACAAIGIALYSFTGQTQYTTLAESYSTLSEEDQLYVREGLTDQLKTDPVFKAYEKMCNEQFRITLISVGKATPSMTQEDFKQRFKSEKALTSFYEKAGVAEPELYGKLEMMKTITLSLLLQKHPEMKSLSETELSSVFASAKTPMKRSEMLKNRAALDKALRERR